MLTQCQQCKKTYSTEIKILCYSNQKHLCPHCEEMLGKLKHLGKNFVLLSDSKPSFRQSSTLGWRLGVIFCLCLLVGQLYFFEQQRILQHPYTRVWLEKFCKALTCELPSYKNSDDFEVMYHDLQQTQHHYIFQAVFSNQGQFKQHYPPIKLTLLSFSDDIFAQRLFKSADYLENSEKKSWVLPSQTVEISLKIVIPKQKVGGYRFELI
ncbi:MAG: DUF3426 domain-containing protein [Methylococcales bacterium]|nr:DUF3426 domain-containing protein [Methylococcales bacterium]